MAFSSPEAHPGVDRHGSNMGAGLVMEAVMNSLKHHEHASHSYERMARLQEWLGRLMVPIAVAAMGAALAYGLLNSTGHVTW